MVFGMFAAIALFVGSFIIWNTFTMTVTQRSREIALLRAIGARRRQVLGSLLLEALVLGLAASAAGIGLGVLRRQGAEVAHGRRRARPAVHDRCRSEASQRSGPRSWSAPASPSSPPSCPARRATKVLPIEALRESTPGAEKPSWRRAVVGVAVLGAGVAAHALARCTAAASFKVFGLGLLAVMVGVLIALPARGASAGRRDRGTVAAARHAGRAGPAERDPQPAPYLGHGCGPDDRPDPGRQHGRVRLLAEGVVRRRARRPDRRRPVRRHLERPGAGLQPGRRGRGGGRGRRRPRSRPTAGERRTSRAEHSSYSSVDPTNADDVHEPRRLAGLVRRPGQGRRGGGEVGRDRARLERRRHRHRGVRPERRPHPADRGASTTPRAGSATTT